jgi:uncharacterized protein (TIGR00251 family)
MQGSVRIQLRVSPGARRTAVVGRYGDGWKVRVAAPPQGGRANAALLRHLAGLLDVPAERLRVVAGAGGRDKLIEIDGLVQAAVARVLDSAAGGRQDVR